MGSALTMMSHGAVVKCHVLHGIQCSGRWMILGLGYLSMVASSSEWVWFFRSEVNAGLRRSKEDRTDRGLGQLLKWWTSRRHWRKWTRCEGLGDLAAIDGLTMWLELWRFKFEQSVQVQGFFSEACLHTLVIATTHHYCVPTKNLQNFSTNSDDQIHIKFQDAQLPR